MPTTVRSYLVAGAAAATATAIALAPVQAAPADIAVPAHPTSSTQPQLTQAMIDLLAAASRMTAAVAPNLAGQAGAAPALGAAPAAAATGEVGVQNAAGNFVESAYLTIQPWVDWAVDYGTDLAYWVGQWVPFVSPITTQVDIFYWQLIRPIANAVVLTFLVPVINDPLNLGVWVNSAGAALTQSFQAAVNFGVAEINEFFGWILPPLPPPFPTVASMTTTQTLAASPLRDAIADMIQQPADFIAKLASNIAAPAVLAEGTDAGPLHSVTDALNEAGENLAATFKKLTDGSGIESLAERLKVPTVPAEANPDAELVSEVRGAVPEVATEVDQQTKQSTDEISVVPRSVRQSLQDAVPATTVADAQETAETVKTAAGEAETVKTPARSVRQGAREAVGKTATDAKAVADNARDAVKTAVKNLTPKPKVKKDKSVSSPEAKQPKGSDGAHDKGASKKDNKK
ncbi:hypothetical protein XA26_45390 [Mycolicibacterium fortuitum]|uniref:PE-PGRS family protein n=1 Tax=Mycolicibacterium fortuitum TaxID=1766 RepID=A0A0N9YAF0_MYCFO|nr:hypothetical protein [Mycolicibacterium fortuitum]ALI28339.1 hypothetical protein XA26_45390 [Mycolicibacterium fortuitum]